MNLINKYIKLLTLTAWVLVPFFLNGQDVIPPSPNAYGLAKYANTGISLYNGTVDVSIPLFELQGRKLTAPVSLSYNGSGNKVQDIAGITGLGWSLNCGGLITRVVKGLPDEVENGYCGENQRGLFTNSTEWIDLWYFAKGYWDGEQDIFYANFMGRTARFVVDLNGLPVLTPHQNIKIEAPIGKNNNSPCWILTDEAGVKYYFGKNENSKEVTKYKGGEEFTSSWYLSEIITPDNSDVIKFEYQTGKDLSYSYYRNSQKYVLTSTWCELKDVFKNLDVSITIIAPKYISSIITSKGKLLFSSEENRADLINGRFLRSISKTDNYGNVLKSYVFNYDYFISDDCSEAICKRLKLLSIDELKGKCGYQLYSFSYNPINLPARNSPKYDHWGFYNDNTHVNDIPTMTDETGILREGASKEPDGTKSQASLLTEIVNLTKGKTSFLYEPHTYFSIGNGNVIADGVRIKEIREYVNGSDIPEKVKSYNYNLEGTEQSSAKISGIPTYGQHGEDEIFAPLCLGCPPISFCRHKYLNIRSNSNTELFDINGSHIEYQTVTEELLNGSRIINNFLSSDEFPDVAPKQFRSSLKNNSALEIIDPLGFPFTPHTSNVWRRGLPKAKKYLDAKGKVIKMVRNFYNFNDTYIKEFTSLLVAYSIEGDLNDFYLGRHKVTSAPVTLSKTEEQIFDDNGSSTTNTTEYEYDPTYLTVKTIKKYTDKSPVKNISRFKYSTDYNLTVVNGYTPTDPFVRGIYGLLSQHNHIQPIESIGQIEKTVNNTVDTKTLAGTFNKFDENGLLKSTYTIKTKDGIRNFNMSSIDREGHFVKSGAYGNTPVVNFDRYDTHGNLLQSTSQDGKVKSYIWGTESPYLNAEVANAPFANVAFANFESEDKGNWSYTGQNYSSDSKSGQRGWSGNISSNSLAGNFTVCLWSKGTGPIKVNNMDGTLKRTQGDWKYYVWDITVSDAITITNSGNIIDEVSLYPQGALLQSYVYNPSGSLSAQTDVNGKYTFYFYDQLERLYYVKDDEGNIVKRYNYFYKDQTTLKKEEPVWVDLNGTVCDAAHNVYKIQKDTNPGSCTYNMTRNVLTGYDPNCMP